MGRAWGDVKERWEALGDDGSEPAQVIADKLDCTVSMIHNYRADARAQDYVEEHRTCTRCGFAEGDRCPIVTSDVEARLRDVLVGEPAEVQEGLCLWCWLRAQGVDYQAFYTSGAWQKVVRWRPEQGGGLAELQKAVKDAMLANGATPLGLSESTGIRMRWLAPFLGHGFSLVWDREILEALCEYAGEDPARYEDLLAG